MNEMRDPIEEWTSSIGKHVFNLSINIIVVAILFAIVFGLVAPVLGPWIKKLKRRQYVMHENYEELAEKDMKYVRIWLWVWAAISWTILIGANVKGY